MRWSVVAKRIIEGIGWGVETGEIIFGTGGEGGWVAERSG